jgi:hypothetical protein
VFFKTSPGLKASGWLAVSGALKASAPSDSPALRVADSGELSLKFVEKQMQVLRLRLAA